MDNKRGIASGKFKKEGNKEIDVPEFANYRYNGTRQKSTGSVTQLIKDSNSGTTRDLKRDVQRKSARQSKKKVKSKPKTISNKRYYDKEKKIRRILAGIAAGIVFVGGYIAWRIWGQNRPEPIGDPTPPAYTEVLETNETQLEHTGIIDEENKSDEIEEIGSYEEVIRDFKETFITKYNQEYGTDYSLADVKIYRNYLEMGVYKTSDDKFVTPGYDYRDTEAILEQNGDFTKESRIKRVIQVVINEGKGEEEEFINTYSCETGDYIISGNSNNIQRDLENEDIPTLERLGIDCKQIVALFDVIEHEELGTKHLKDYIKIYDKAAKTEKIEATEGFEMVD